MKVIDHVNKAINSYPGLYMLRNYEESTFAVLHHCFIVLGNGTEWAETDDPKTGGYLTSPQYRKVKEEWIRIKDKPYGEEKCELDPRAFKEKIYYFEKIDKKRSGVDVLIGESEGFKIVFESELEDLKKKFKVCDGHKDYNPDVHTHSYFLVGENENDKKNPYPNFQKKYSPFWEIEPQLIQEDWRVAGLDHLKYWQTYFNDEERVKGYHYYKHPESLKEYIIKHYKDNPEKHPNWIQDVRDGYEIQEFDGANFEEFETIRWEKELKKTKDFLLETIERLECV